MYFLLLAISSLPAVVVLSHKRFYSWRWLVFATSAAVFLLSAYGVYRNRYVVAYQLASISSWSEYKCEFCINGIRDYHELGAIDRLFIERIHLFVCRDECVEK